MTAQEPGAGAATDQETRALTAEITEAMVRLYKDLFGRGPTRARTDFAGPDTLVSSLWDTLTPGEVGLIAAGHADRARETRILFQYSRQSEFVAEIEQRLARRVVGFVSGIDVHADIATEVFYLEAHEDHRQRPST